MSQFEFLLVFVSLIAAFAVSDVLMCWGEEIRLRRQVRHYAVHTAWSLAMLFALVQVWWSLWDYSSRPAWTFREYIVLVLPFLTLSLMVYVLTPKFGERPEERDVKAHYYGNTPWIFGLGMLYLVFWMLFAVVLLDEPLKDPRSMLRSVMLVVFALLALSRNERLHVASAVLVLMLIVLGLVGGAVRAQRGATLAFDPDAGERVALLRTRQLWGGSLETTWSRTSFSCSAGLNST
jgi:hypothetical protein